MRNFQKLDDLLKNFADHSVPGCACTIMKKDEIIYEGYAGYADIDAKERIHAKSMFRQASTTKLFTYAIVAMLFEEGKFLLSDPIYEYLPEWKHMTKYYTRPNNELDIVPLEKPITIKDVVTMACGLPYCMSPDVNSNQPVIAAMSKALLSISGEQRATLREEVRAVSQVPVLFEPGTHWLYGFGSEITGAIVEEITGKPLRNVFKERIIEPLGLKDTDTYITEHNRGQVVNDYLKDNGTFMKTSSDADVGYDLHYTPVGARVGLLASSNDFAIFMQMLANGGYHKGERMLGRKTIDLLRTNYLNETQLMDFNNNTYLAGYGYGLGFRTLMDKSAGNHNGSLGAFGWTGGSGIWVEADPEEKVSIVYMHNMRPNEELYHHLRIRNVAYGCLD
ncbi:MAG TPA: serine hydrolase domain-containing protein [Mobilitalea sp.]|nr:serine hydrolase domain-containing protein [Mobilitalea sp.]